MSEPLKSKHAALLNDLDAMQKSVAYAMRRSVLAQAEAVIVDQERVIAEQQRYIERRRAAAKLDRGDAVNLAFNIRESDNIENVTRKGWLSLVDAVLRMDAALREITK